MAITDTLGVMVAGAGHEAVEILADTLGIGVDAGLATLVGGRGRTGVLDAALVNGTAAHMLDYDDSNSDLFGHLSAAILPSLLSLAESEGANGRHLLVSFLAGYEAGCRFGNAVSRFQYTHGWHPTATVGIFAAVSACAVLIGLDDRRTAMALGIATHLASGIKSNFGSMTKPLGVGHASRSALMAVLLAKRGFTSGERAFEHHHGYFSVFNQNALDTEPLLTPWSPGEKILDPAKGLKQKRFPCCFAIAPILDCVADIRNTEGLDPADIVAIVLRVHPIRFPHIDVPDPRTGLAAKFSATYCAARMLVAGRVEVADFEDGGRLVDQWTRELIARASLQTYRREQLSGAEVDITTRNGHVLSRSVDAARGATSDNPLTPAMVSEKFDDCVSRRLGTVAASALWQRLQALADCSDVADLTALTRFEAPSGDTREVHYG
ncbi:MmgE/PrpD family protein [Pelagibacterium nitratireducens]|uniref:MmgE/PrpD family protein n=1 Tax=Pelagibacterium nitratireducens TaxID=1046114 RepID=A0ABZ2I3T0_9HYPH